MKRITAILILITLVLCGSFACSKKTASGESYFSKEDVVSSSFDGLGVEWGTYEDINKTVKGSWDRVIASVDKLNPSLVRCMTNLDWFVVDFDDKDTEDLSDDTWNYTFNNKYMKNACDVLDYCQAHGIRVAFGVWNVIGNVDPEKDLYKMIPNATSDLRWAKMIADLMEYLIKIKGYDCIRWFVNTNEPNNVGVIGSSKNAYNTYAKWEAGVRNVRRALDAVDLSSLDIIGGDTTGIVGSTQYLPKVASNLKNIVRNYGLHMYVSNYDIDNARYQKNLSNLYKKVQKNDKFLGRTKQMIIWEAGLLDGKNVVTDCNAYITSFSYGLRMADYTVQSILSGINGLVYWDLDDAMHFMYNEGGNTPKEWGMFSTLASATSAKQEYRPWFHSTVLLTNLFRPGNTIYRSSSGADGVRTLATVSADRKKGGFVAVNSTRFPVTEEFALEEPVEGSGKLYIYVYSQNTLKLGADGFVVPNYVIDGSLNAKTKIEIPASAVVFVSSERI
ncbi:MAG: hypothetical protein K5753_01705 [Clostridia bacterium]|nr:hypothetical protein [Clostridia bacterium]